MTDQEYILCTWRKRLWPAKVLRKTGVSKGISLEVEILGLNEQISVSCADVEPLKEEHIVNIASNLDQRNNLSEAVEELQYRRSLKIALDILNSDGSPKQVPPSENRPSTQFSQENHSGSRSLTPLRSFFKDKLEPQASKRKGEKKTNPSLKTDLEKTKWKGSFVLEESAEAHESGTNPSGCDTEDLSNTLNSESQNSKVSELESLPRQKTIEPRLTKSRAGNKVFPKPKEEKSKQGRKQPSSAGFPVLCRNDFPKDQVQPFAEEGSAQSVPCTSGTVVPVRSTKTRSQLRRTLLDSSCKSASDDLEKSISSESGSLSKQLDGRKKPASLKRVNGDRKIGATASSYRKRKCRNCSESSSGPSNEEMLSDSISLQCKEEESKNTTHVVMNKVKPFQLSDFEEDEGLESSNLSSEILPSESLSRLSPLVDEEEEDEELPSVLSHQEPQSIEEGILVWCRLRRYPYWPAVVKTVKRKHRKACVLLIEEDTNDKKKGFSVPLRSLKHFDCEEKQDLIERAKEDYRQEIEWCIRLISDYRIRVGCHSFTGSFLEYFADDISYPVRKEGYQGLVQITFPDVAEEDTEEALSETSLQKPSRKLLPDRTRAARDKANKKIVEFIVKTKGADEHLLAILKSRKQSRWLKGFLNSRQYVTCVETYLEDEEQLDLVVNYLKEVYHEIEAKDLHHINGDGIKFISDVLLPEAIIYAISAVDDIDYKKAEEKYIKGPSVSKREREIFDEEILERKRWKTKPELADGV
ncbi:PWWP domain-containing DNA repair factor 3A isoform X2 [Melopsittacus undulatus]|nr:PWWP domain-containing DNA repair factor 3A isoform X2 [Melopsittacus undulatus]XP_030910852.2 PWWP domain-containing DNA repair factor 3A isoform X2 [Melopsittacus undulatus]XP_030910853.2 PWWP domain-containing DNA repair factor 3A isoform X2 [Melopsittacus undulatus]XP_030910855.2 PWWP domain-containing DNA repair factor 3A isoform X2 [Melopsittacus undulatus]